VPQTMTRKLIIHLLTASLGCACGHGLAAEPWSTTQFEVAFPPQCDPWVTMPLTSEQLWNHGAYRSMSEADQEETGKELGWSSLEEIKSYFQLIETYLSDIADRYQSLGFAEPNLRKTSGGKFVVVYYDFSNGQIEDCDSGSASKAFAVNPFDCDERIKYIALNAASWSPNGRRERDKQVDYNPRYFDSDGGRYDEPGLYTTLAHELFHTIQGAYDLASKSIQPCGQKDWGLKDEGIVVEGMAQGVAVEAAAEHARMLGTTMYSSPWNQAIPHAQDRKVLGGYPFIYNIFAPPKGSAYYLASFWRYLADRHGGWANLDQLLGTPAGTGRPNDLARAQWIDGVLRKPGVAGESLYTVFPAAVTEIVSFGQKRYTHGRVRQKWLEWVSKKGSGCQRADTSNQTAKFELDLQPWSATCFEISWYGFPNEVELHFEAIVPDGEGQAEMLADQLHLGLALREIDGKTEDCWSWTEAGRDLGEKTTCLYEKVQLSSGPRPGTHARWWIPDEETKRDFRKRGKYVLVLSNIAPANRSTGSKLRRTEEISNLVFRVGFGGTRDANGQPLPPPRGRNMLGTTGLGHLVPGPADQRQATGSNLRIMAMSGGGSPIFAASSAIAAMVPAAATAGALTDLGLPNLQSFMIGEPGERQYLVTPVVGLADYELGYTGPLQGEVVLYDPEIEETSLRFNRLPDDPEDLKKAYSGRIVEGPGSKWCQSGAGAVEINQGVPSGGRIGTITRSSEDELVIEIDAELCRMTFNWGDEQPEFEAVERAHFTMTLPFGWRYFNKSMPQAVDTPGLAWYDERFPQARRAANLATGRNSELPDPFTSLGLSHPGEIPGVCSCGCDELLGLDPAANPECASPGCINQLTRCRAPDKARETVVVSYRGTIGIRALMALRKDYDERGILNQNLDERNNTITVLFRPSMIEQREVEQFLRDLGVDVVQAAAN